MIKMIVVVGECMVEMVLIWDNVIFKMGFVGDMLNIVWYLCKIVDLEWVVDYVIVVGIDVILDKMVDFLGLVGFGMDWIWCDVYWIVGLYMIELINGE